MNSTSGLARICATESISLGRVLFSIGLSEPVESSMEGETMRSNDSIAGNPWPHDMVISIEEHDHALLRLLFVRDAWGLSPNGAPAVSGAIDVGASSRPNIVDLGDADARWRLEWRANWQRFDEHDRAVHALTGAKLRRLDAVSDEELIEKYSRMPSRYWDQGVDDRAFARWRDEQLKRSEQRRQLPLTEHPERRSLSALISAWECGLTNIVQLPYKGYFADRISRHCLVVSEAARFDAVLYGRALSAPPPETPPTGR
ncbi:hypothetical protein [Subtercola endophyticus]|uniref:hypothetical protein n=1 Tax=Subtercola endophyticus TaxID=2895559 RepID=UPI001E5C32A4|nr:hypothetical protein [Subtercola endophyticus]UFS60547.1 hypothetical protein LQ955_07350 [Subtercola endophyticus]